MSRRAAIYARQSKDLEEGIERQLPRCAKLIEARGWDIAHTFTDNDVSASKARGVGTGWGDMLAAAKRGEFDVLVAVDVDRLLRSISDLVVIMDTGVAVLTVDGEIDLTTADGEFRATMLTGIARFEVRRKAERQKRANEARASQGMSHRGNRPFGWELGGNVVRESEAVHIRHAADLILAGGSIRSVIRYFEEQEIPAPRGGRWSNASVRTLLTRHRIAGILVRHGEVQPKSVIEPILDVETWEEVRAMILDPERQTNKGKLAPSSWLAGTLQCPCGARLGSSWKQSRGKKLRTYVCRAVIETTDRYKGEHVSITAEAAEGAGEVALYAALGAGSDEQGGEVARMIRKQIAELDEQRARSEQIYTLTGSATSLAMLQQLTAERDERRRELDHALAQRGAERVLQGARAAWAAAGVDSDAWRSSIATFARAFRALPIEQRRALAHSSIIGRVDKHGRGASRVLWTMLDGEEIGRSGSWRA